MPAITDVMLIFSPIRAVDRRICDMEQKFLEADRALSLHREGKSPAFSSASLGTVQTILDHIPGGRGPRLSLVNKKCRTRGWPPLGASGRERSYWRGGEAGTSRCRRSPSTRSQRMLLTTG